jgi:hypothetical protein
MDSLPPVENPVEEIDRPTMDDLPPAVRQRRARLRRVVGAFLGLAAIFFVTGVSKQILASRSRSQAWIQPAAAAVNRAPAAEAAQPQAANPVAAPEVKPAEPLAAAQPPTEEPSPAAEAKPAPSPEPIAEASPPNAEQPENGEAQIDPAQSARLSKEAESLLNRGKTGLAVAASRSAIAADPSQALPYLLLGTALQSSGQWKDGIEAYCECVRHASKGPVAECRAVGGHK